MGERQRNSRGRKITVTEREPIYELDGKISIAKAIPFGLQHVLAMFMANVTPILIVGGAAKLSSGDMANLIQAAMVIAGKRCNR